MLTNALSPSHQIVADVAIGEPATPTPIEKQGQSLSWYGFIRLIVFVKSDSHHICGNGRLPKVVTCVYPTGQKLSQYDPCFYHGNRSPDKGGVSVSFPDLKLMVTSLHLDATNKSDMDEFELDHHRRLSMRLVTNGMKEMFSNGSERRFMRYRKITMGDLNFRVQMHSDVKAGDMSKGGKDFVAVRDIAASSSKEGWHELFHRHDRLNTWLKNVLNKDTPGVEPAIYPLGKEECEDQKWGALEDEVLILTRMKDCLAELAPNKFVRPTFKYRPLEAGAKPPRVFDDKRTPSWTDRILYSNEAMECTQFGVERNVCASDHDPVFAGFSMKSAFVETPFVSKADVISKRRKEALEKRRAAEAKGATDKAKAEGKTEGKGGGDGKDGGEGKRREATGGGSSGSGSGAASEKKGGGGDAAGAGAGAGAGAEAEAQTRPRAESKDSLEGGDEERADDDADAPPPESGKLEGRPYSGREDGKVVVKTK